MSIMMVGAVSQSAMAGNVLGVGALKCSELYSPNDGSIQEGLLNASVTYAEGTFQDLNQYCNYKRDQYQKNSVCLFDKLRVISGVGPTYDGKVSIDKMIRKGIITHCYRNDEKTINSSIWETFFELRYKYLIPHEK